MKFPKIVHVITDLDGFGGTEATLLRYLGSTDIPQSHQCVIVIKSTGVGDTLGAQMVDAGYSVIALKHKYGWQIFPTIFRLFRELKRFEPDVISGWLYQPSLMATVLAPWLRKRPSVIWHIRSLPFARIFTKPARFLVQRFLATCSRLTHPIMVSNSSAAQEAHIAIGFNGSSKNWIIIPNGIDTAQYFPDKEMGNSLRAFLGIPIDALVIGCVGRFVPEKGYAIMFEALGIALETLPPQIASRIHFVAVGKDVTLQNKLFRRLVVRSTLTQERLHMLGPRADVPKILRTFDVFVLPSISESFPNSLVEAMASGLTCIATNVGSCGEVLNSSSFIVPPGNASLLANRLVDVLAQDDRNRHETGQRNRKRIEDHFAIAPMVARLDALFMRVR